MLEADLVAVHHGYECRYYPTVVSGPVVRWTLPGGDGRWEVSASRDGVVLRGGSPALDADRLHDLNALLVFQAGPVAKVLAGLGNGRTEGLLSLLRATGDKAEPKATDVAAGRATR